MSAATTHLPVDYVESARRHRQDAQILMEADRQANAGQLLGFSVECGLKALLIACGVEPDPEGSVRDALQNLPLCLAGVSLPWHPQRP